MISNICILANVHHHCFFERRQSPAQSSQFLSLSTFISTTLRSHDYISSVRKLSLTQLPFLLSLPSSFQRQKVLSLQTLTSCLDLASKVYPTASKPTTQCPSPTFKVPRTTLLSSQGLCQASLTTTLPHITRSTCLAPNVKSSVNDPSLRVSPNKTRLTVTHISLADNPTALLRHILLSLEKPLSRSFQEESTDGNENMFSNTQFPLAFYTMLTLTLQYKKNHSH